MKINRFSILILFASQMLAGTPSITNLSNSNYSEQDPAYILDNDINVTNGLVYSNSFLEVGITSNGDSGDNFSLNSSSTPNALGHISISGSDVFLGQSDSKTQIGRLDGTKNGVNGQPFRINFNDAVLTGTPAIINGNFDNNLDSWNTINAEVNLGTNLSGTSIQTPSDSDVTYPNKNIQYAGGDDDDLSWGGDNWEVEVISGRLRLQERSMTVSSYGVVHGPAAYSNTFSAEAGGILKFEWEANYVNDDYHVAGYLIDQNNNITIALDATGTRGSGTASVIVPSTGQYMFVFISGTYDRTGGRAAGASMFIDNVRVEDAMIVDAVIETIIENIKYSNISDDPNTSKILTISTEDTDRNAGSATSTINISTSNDQPISNNVNGSGNEGNTISTTLTAIDPDNPDPSTLTFTIVNQPTNINGSISIGNVTLDSGIYSAVATYTHDDTQTTSDSFTYKINDSTLDSDVTTATITINPVNDAPISSNTNGNGSEGGTITSTLTATDVDNTDPNSFIFSIVSQPSNITGSINIANSSFSSGTFTAVATYTHDGSETTSDSFTYKANDRADDSNTSTATLSITPVNDPPVSANVNGNGNEAGTITTTLTATDVDNTDPNTFTFTIINQPTNITGNISIGSVSFSSGTFSAIATYTHDGSETTSDSFTYKANDGALDSNVKTATISIATQNDTPDNIILSSNTINENENSGSAIGSLSSSDNDSGDSHTYTLVSGTGSTDNGSFAISGSNLNTGSSFNFESKSSYSVRIRTTDNGTGNLYYEEAFTITVNDINEAPVITSNSSGSTATISHAENNTSTITTVTSTDVDAGSSATYSISGTDAEDFNINSSTGILTFASTPNYESPIDADANNSYIVIVTVTDNGSLTDTQTITVNVTNVNEPPISENLTAGGNDADVNCGANKLITVQLTATDVDNSNASDYTFSITQQPSNKVSNVNIGSKSITSTSPYKITATATYRLQNNSTCNAGDDNFKYKINDGTDDSNVATVTINPGNNVAPDSEDLPSSGTISVNEGGSTTITLKSDDSSDANLNSSNFTFSIIRQPNHTSNTLSPANSTNPSNNKYESQVTYTHNGGETTSDNFTYKANDSQLDSDISTVTITINSINDAPSAISLSSHTVNENENSGTNVSTLATTDEESGDDHTYTLVSGSGDTDNSSFTISGSNLKTGASFNFESKNSYSVRIRTTDDGTPNLYYEDDFSITINDVNEAPVIRSNGEESTATISFSENDESEVTTVTSSDVDTGSSATYSISGTDAADFTINSNSGILNFINTPNYEAPEDSDANNSYIVIVTVTDNRSLTDTQTITVNITDANDPPITAPVDGNGKEGQTITTILTATDAETTDKDSISFNIVNQPSYINGAIAIGDVNYDSSNKTFSATATYTHDGSETTNDSFTYRASDTFEYSTVNTATIAIIPVNDAPLSANVNGNGNEAGTITTTLTATDVDNIDRNTFTFTIINKPTNITGNISIGNVSFSSGTFSASATYTHNGNETTSDSFTYKANDGNLDSDITTATIIITPINDPPISYKTNGGGAENATITILLTATDVDNNIANSFKFNIVDQPMKIINNINIDTVSYTAGTFSAIATYTHDGSENQNDPFSDNVYIGDYFTYRAYDGTDYSELDTAIISITPINDKPIITEIGIHKTNEDVPDTIKLYVSDPDNISHQFSIYSLDRSEVQTNIVDSTLYLSTLPNWNGSTYISIKVEEININSNRDLLSDIKPFTFIVDSVNDKPTKPNLQFPSENFKLDIYKPGITSNAISRNYEPFDFVTRNDLILKWEPSIDVDEDELTYLVYAEWDTTNQLDHSIKIVFDDKVKGTQYIVPHEKLFEALDLENRIWLKQPILKWVVDVTDGRDTTFNETSFNLQIAYYTNTLETVSSGLIPNKYTLYQNYPNPFNPITRIDYDIPEASNVQIIIFDILGREVSKLKNSWHEPGHYSAIWNCENDSKIKVSSGMYFYYLKTNNYLEIRKMIYLK